MCACVGLPSETLSTGSYLPEDSGCQRLVGQEKTHHLGKGEG